MSTARNLLRDLALIGATIQPEGDRLILRAGAIPVPAGLVSRVRRAKAELLATLANGDVKKDLATLVEPNLVAPPDWFQRIASPAEGEPRFDEPCTERRGQIKELPGPVFLHFCIECGRWHLRLRRQSARRAAGQVVLRNASTATPGTTFRCCDHRAPIMTAGPSQQALYQNPPQLYGGGSGAHHRLRHGHDQALDQIRRRARDH
jgi:hypothetical protein